MQTPTSVQAKRLKLIDRFHNQRGLSVEMANKGVEGSETRRKRAWRKPREALGPGDPIASPVPPNACASSVDHGESRKQPAPQQGPCKEPAVASRSSRDTDTTDSAPRCESLVEIDGSIMEGVSRVCVLPGTVN